MNNLNTIADGLNTLLASYAEPCIGDCEHSQCPLLRELHALRIRATLEKARLTVKPIVDRERQGEQIGDLMNMHLDAPAPRATGETVDVLVRREDAARAAELVNDSIKAKGKFAAAIIMMPPYPAPDCPICGYPIDNEGLCVLDAAHTTPDFMAQVRALTRTEGDLET